MRPQRWLACTAFLGVLFASSAATADWSLWPFRKAEATEPEPARSRPMTASADFWKADLDQEPSRPSLFDRMAAGTQRFFSSTKQALSFSRAKKPSPVNRVGTSTRQQQPSESGSWLEPDPPEAPRTMKEWWRLKRPDPL